jgi:protein-tyrosine kinase
MREVDEALARAYGHPHTQRDQVDPSPSVPPAPHLPSGALKNRSAAGRAHGEVAPIPAGSASDGLVEWPSAELDWPPIVRELERQWSQRFETLAQSLLAARQRQNLKVILFTSCHRAEGRTTLVLTLARALARHPLRTLLVDADLTGPMVARLLALRPVVGLDDVVERGQAVADALIDAPVDHLAILPMRAGVSRPRDFLASPAWTCTLARLRREFDLVLIDGGPLFTGLSAAVLHRSVDAAVLVHHRGMTGERAVLRAREVLEAGGVPLLGLADTFV